MARRALLCGINDYLSVADLRGCVRDVESMRTLLQTVYGFRHTDISVLTNQEVTKSRLEKEWKWLMKGAGAGDTLVFHFSGHGSYLPDGGGYEDDGNDELMCLYDMDFGRPGTYLLDDEFRVWTEQKPAGAELIVVTDCCHSATNTRMVLTEVRGEATAFALDLAATVRVASRTDAPPDVVEVRARFIPPPAHLPGPARAARTRRAAARPPGPLNHLHLAACQDNETAADAPIGGAYHGAFTYHLCRALEADPAVGSTDLVSRLGRALSSSAFSQHPSVEGDPHPGPLFGGPPAPPSPPGHPPAGPGLPSGALTETTARELTAAIRDLTTALRRDPGPAAGSRQAGRRVLVCVHGIDEHPGDFSLPWWNALRPHVGGAFGNGDLGDTRVGVHWSDIVNPRALAPRGAGPDVELARLMIERQLGERSARFAERGRAAEARGAVGTRGGGPQIDDFLRYMFQSSVRDAVLARFTDAVRPRLAAGEVLDVISHSWGTVVAYEGLLQLEAEALPGRVATLFTVGAALSIGAVRWQLGLGGRRPAQAGRWANVNAAGDSIGGGIGANFPIDQEYLDLSPTGCTRGWFGYNLGCAHGSYFRPDNLAVNRDIFARHILEG